MSKIFKKRFHKGSFIPSVMVFAVVGVIIVGTLVTYSLFQLRNGEYLANRTASFQIAEAGIQYYAWYLKHTPQTGTEKFSDGNTTKSDTDSSAIITDGSEFNGPYTHQYTNADGQTVGTYELYIKAPNPNDPAITVKSIGQSLNSSIKRTIIARMEEEPLMEYTVLADKVHLGGSMRYANVIPIVGNYSGKIHSNSHFFWDGTLKTPNSSAYSGDLIYDANSAFIDVKMSTTDSRFHDNVQRIDFSYIYSRYFDKMREESGKAGNHYLGALINKPKYYVYLLYLTGDKVKEYILPLKISPDTFSGYSDPPGTSMNREFFLYYVEDRIISNFNECNLINYEAAKARAARRWLMGPSLAALFTSDHCIDVHLGSTFVDMADIKDSNLIATFDITNNLIFTDAPTAVIGDPANPLNGKLTITSTQPILLQNDIQYKRNPDGTRAENTGLVLATKNVIKFTQRSSFDLNLDGYFIALKQRGWGSISNPVFVQYMTKLSYKTWDTQPENTYPPTCTGPRGYKCLGTLNIFGGITASSNWNPGYGFTQIFNHENLGSYKNINMDPDLNLIRNSPLYAPSTGKIKIISWEVVEDD